jgi:hypothetical protein
MDDEILRSMQKAKWTVHVQYVDKDHPMAQPPAGSSIPQMGPTIADLRRHFGDVAKIPDPAGAEHEIDLRKYDHLDPQRTRLIITFLPDRFLGWMAPPPNLPPELSDRDE